MPRCLLSSTIKRPLHIYKDTCTALCFTRTLTVFGKVLRVSSCTYLDEMTVNGDVSPTDEEPIVRNLDQ